MSIYHRAVIGGAAAEPEWQPEEFGVCRALLLACIPVTVGIAASIALLSAATLPLPPVRVQLVEPQAANAGLSSAEPAPEPAPAEPARAEAVASAPPATPDPVPAAAPEMTPPAGSSAPVPLTPVAAVVDTTGQTLLGFTPPEPTTERPPMHLSARRNGPNRPRQAFSSSRTTAGAATAATPVTTPVATVPTSAATSPPTQTAALPRTDTSSGIGPYRAGLHAQIERNMMADESVRRLGITGVATILAVIAPDGSIVSATLASSSGNWAIDRAAQAAVQRGGFRAFNPHMPSGPITISVPIAVGDD